MPSCAVKWCKSHSDNSKDSGISFHVFPQDPIRRERWKKAVQLERNESDWMPSKASRICSIHFKDEDFYLSNKGFKMLHKTAIPICTMVFSSEKSPPLTKSETRQADTQNVNKIPATIVMSLSKALPFKLSNKENVAETPSPQKRRLVSCPSCGHHFGVPGHVDVEDSYEMVHRRQPTSLLPSNDLEITDRILCVTPLNILSSDIESAFNTPKTQKLKRVQTITSESTSATRE